MSGNQSCGERDVRGDRFISYFCVYKLLIILQKKQKILKTSALVKIF